MITRCVKIHFFFFHFLYSSAFICERAPDQLTMIWFFIQHQQQQTKKQTRDKENWLFYKCDRHHHIIYLIFNKNLNAYLAALKNTRL